MGLLRVGWRALGESAALSLNEEPDAKEVMDLIKAEGRKAIALPGDPLALRWTRCW